MRNTKTNIGKQSKEEKKIQQKKVCQYCRNNEYNGNYSHHLRNQHKKELGIRQLVKSLNSQELEQIKEYVLKEIKKK